MNALDEYLVEQIEQRLARRPVLVFFDPRSEFTPFFDQEANEGKPARDGLVKVAFGKTPALLARYSGSYFALRAGAEENLERDEPEHIVLYVPDAAPDDRTSVLKELESAGTTYRRPLKRVARELLRRSYPDSEIDRILASDALTYEDIVSYLEQASGDTHASILQASLGERSALSALERWIVSDEFDRSIVEKGGRDELYHLIETRLGLALSPQSDIHDAREKTLRYMLITEFRADFDGEAPSAVSMVPVAPSAQHETHVLELNRALRGRHPDRYAELADHVEGELNLRAADIDAGRLATTDTFPFEERALLGNAADLILDGKHAAALEIVSARAHSFWLDRDVARQAQWGACRLAAELGMEVARIDKALESYDGSSAGWVADYAVSRGGWFEADRLQRRLQAWCNRMDDEPEAGQAIDSVLYSHRELLKRMASGFSCALVDSGWVVPGILHQTEVYPEAVRQTGRCVAYFLVDGMRFEMGVELAERLAGVEDLTVRPAVAAVPTITPVGMAALLPGASADFSVVDGGGKLCARVDGAVLGDLEGRVRYFKSRVPEMIDLTLAKVLDTRPKRLQSSVRPASLVLVRSQEIDAVGEMDDSLIARQIMDTLLGNIAHAVRKLASAGVEAFVITADHGHQFASRMEEDMRTDSPGGETVELHRRCWAGRGGATPAGTVRASGAEVGYTTDLDFAFPKSLGVFKAGGGLAYHHGGVSLQELVIPVVSFRIPPAEAPATPGRGVQLIDVPKVLTNRTFGVRLAAVGDLLSAETISVRVLLVAGDRYVGQVGMAVDAELDRATGVVDIAPGCEASLGIMLTAEDCETARLVALDPGTDAVLAQSEEIAVRLAI